MSGEGAIADIYGRVSDPKQELHGTSLETQEAAGRAWCAERGISVRHVFLDTFPGVELWDRPKMTACREAIRRDPPDYLVIHALDRLAREPDHQAVVMSEAEYHEVEVVFVSETFDKTPQGKLLRDVGGYVAKVEHLKIQERTQRGLRARIAAGKPSPGARVLYGYRWNEARTAYLVDPVTGPVVERIFREALSGRTLRAIARGLTANGIPTPKGGAVWVYTVISKILVNARYRGHCVETRYQSQKAKGATKSGRQRRVVTVRPEEEQRPLPAGTIPPLVEASVQAAIGERLALNKARSSRNNREPEASLLRGGYARCGYCDRVMSAVTLSNGQRIYRCAAASATKCYHGISTHLLDAAVWERIEQALSDRERIAREVEVAADADPSGPDLAAISRTQAEAEAELAQLSLQLGKVTNAVAVAAVVGRMDALGARIEVLGQEKTAVLAHHATRLAAADTARRFVDWLAVVEANLTQLSYQQRRLALDALGVRVTVYRADHAPRWTMTARVPLEAGGEAIVYPTPARWVHNITLAWSDADHQARVAS